VDKKRSSGEVMDLASGMPYVSPVEIFTGDFSDLKDSDIVVITAGKKQLPAQSRAELSRDNVGLFKTIIPEVVKYAEDAVFVVVTNPVDVLSYATYKISGKSHAAVIGSGTVLDSARLRFLLSKHCNVDARNIHAYILGEHGDSEFPVWSKAMIGGAFLEDYCILCNRCDHKAFLKNIFEEVRDFAYKIIERKGETSYGVGLALTRISEAVLKDENSILAVSCFVDDYYGIKDIYMGLPAVINKTGVREILKLKLNDEELKRLRASAQALTRIIKDVGL
jgi:L-lactate dehydrogenase